jgi:RNA polymerase sigma-70 factor (ECF subfamily)
MEVLQAQDPVEAVLSRAAIVEAFESLGPVGSRDRETWRLAHVEDRPVAEVADLMGVPVGTVKSRLHRARRVLRMALRGGPAAAGGAE